MRRFKVLPTLALLLFAPVLLPGCPTPEPTVTVPDVRGLNRTGVESMLSNADLVLGAVTEAFDDTVVAGLVVSQRPAGGARVAAGSSIAITVSLGPDPGGDVELTVPDIVGQPLGVARSTIESTGFVVGGVSEQPSATVPAGDVISQDPAAGAVAQSGTAIDLVVSQGPDPVGPSAAFTMNFAQGAAPLIVQFEDQSDPGTAAITSWSWSFDDGASGADNTSASQNPVHAFNGAGSFNVSLTVLTAHGSDTTSRTITVSPGNGEIARQGVRVVDDIPTLTLDSSSGDDYAFIYSGNGEPPVKPGDILVGTEGEGYLRRVSAVKSVVSKAGGAKSISLSTEFCSLAEAIDTGTLRFDTPVQFAPEDLAGSGATLEKGGSGFVSLNGFSLSSSSSLDVLLSGRVGFSPSVDFDLGISGGNSVHIALAAGGVLDLELGARIELSASGSVSFEKSLFPVTPPRKISVKLIAGIPVVVVTQFDLLAGVFLESDGSASLDTGISTATEVRFGAEYSAGSWTDLTSIDLSATPMEPVWMIEQEFGVKVYIKPVISVRLYGVSGPSVAAIPHLGFNVRAVPLPVTAELRAGIDAEMAFDLINLEIIDVDFATGYSKDFAGPSNVLWTNARIEGTWEGTTYRLPFGGWPEGTVFLGDRWNFEEGAFTVSVLFNTGTTILAGRYDIDDNTPGGIQLMFTSLNGQSIDPFVSPYTYEVEAERLHLTPFSFPELPPLSRVDPGSGE